MAGSVNIREIVFDMLMTMEKEHVPSHILLNQTLTKYQYLDKRDRAMLSRLFRGTLEYHIFLDGVLLQFIKTDWRKVKRLVCILLRLGSYQILKMDSVRDATACDEMVKLAKRRGLKNLSGFINGVLRNVSANKEKIVYPNKETEKAAYLSMRYALPEWLVKQWLLDYDFDTVAGMGEAMLSNQATTVRMRFQKNGHHLVKMRDDKFETTREILIHELEAADLQVDEGYIFKDALRISGYDYLGKLNAFKEGRLTVQDEGSMLAAVVSGAKKGDRIIDVCAAPGG